MMIKAVVFDIGNVLVEWHPERFFDQAIGQDRRRALFSAVDLHSMNERVDLGAPFHDSVAALAEAHPDWSDEIRLWGTHWIEMFQPVIDHSVHLLNALQTQGVPVFSLTNFGADTYDMGAERYPFMRAFDRDFISGQLRMMKPDPAIYAALETASGLSGAQLIFTDDRADNIAAAHARGWQTHLFKGPEGWADRLVAEGLLTQDAAWP